MQYKTLLNSSSLYGHLNGGSRLLFHAHQPTNNPQDSAQTITQTDDDKGIISDNDNANVNVLYTTVGTVSSIFIRFT